VLGSDFAGEVTETGRLVSRFAVGDAVFGTVAPRAASVIDYTRTDFTRGGRRYDVVFDVAGKSSFLRCRGVLRPRGVYLTTGVGAAIMVQMAWTARLGRSRAVVAFSGLRAAELKRQDLLFTRDLAEKSALTAVIGGRYPLARISEAHARVCAGHKKGNIVVTMA